MLKGKKIYLRRVEEKDALSLFMMENNENHWRVSGTEIPYSLDEINAYITNAQNYKSSGQLRLMICTIKTDSVVGAVDLFEMNFKHLRAGVGILISNTEDRGKGYAKEALVLMEEFAYKSFSFNQLFCNIQSDNEKSIQLFEGLGFIKCGTKKEWYTFNDVVLDELVYQKIF